MRKALEDYRPRGMQQAASDRVPAPTKGWNTKDPLVGMDPRFAIKMDNWLPRERDIKLRDGYTEHGTGASGNFQTLAVYKALDGTQEMWGWTSDGDLHDVSVAGAIPAATLSGLSNALWQHCQMTTSGGTYMLAFNGADDSLLYDGATWVVNAAAGAPITWADGSTASQMINCQIHKSRVWLIKANSLTAYYLGAGAIGGAATAFPLGPAFKRGGYLLAMGSWTIDAGEGVDDYAVFISSEGEAVVYQGTDPASALTWDRVGTFTIPKPIGRRCVQDLGGDCLILTQQGVYPITKALASATVNKTIAVTDKISTTFTQYAVTSGTLDNWESILWTADNLLIINVPGIDNGAAVQLVMNTVTGAWCRFTGFAAYGWTVFNNLPFFGGAGGTVWRALNSSQDNGNDRTGEVITAYQAFGATIANKHVSLVRPLLTISGPLEMQFAILVDYQPLGDFQDATISFPLAGIGDTSVWDGVNWDEAVWSFDEFNPMLWRTVTQRPGHALAFGLRAMSKYVNVRLNAIDLLFNRGGVL